MGSSITVKPVRGRRERKAFAECGRLVHPPSSRFIAPLDSDVVDYVTESKNPFFAEAHIEHFIAWRDDDPVGRIAAVIEQRYVDHFGPTGWFGWFDCINDTEVAGALLGTVEGWLRDRGMARVEGPYSYDATQEFGLLVEGFGHEPALMQPHHEPYYQDLLRQSGYRKRFGTSTYSWTLGDPGLEAVSERGRRALDGSDMTVRSPSLKQGSKDLESLWELFVATFSNQHDMLPMTREVFDWQLQSMKFFLDEKLVRVVEKDGQAIAFSFLAADANEVLKVAQGRMTPLTLARLPMLLRRVTGTVVLMIGVRAGFEATGAGRVIAGQIADVALGKVGRYSAVHTTWIHDDNRDSHALVNRTGAKPRRRYEVVGKDL
ncbi:MAG: hypothetical protein L0H31_15905 [Nocardioidaceae bacterium]|nr:hypothetical protein [Nocardioidaceae bacterium]